MHNPDDRKWVEKTANLLGKLGFSEVRVRWRLNKWLDQRSQSDVHQTPDNNLAGKRLDYVNCFYCRALQTKDDAVCYQCKKPVQGTTLDRLTGSVRHYYENFNVMLVLGVLFGLGFLRLIISSGGEAAWSPSGMLLFSYGAVYGPAVWMNGEWIRLLSGAFLHGGVVHLGFNLLALTIIAPRASSIFGERKSFIIFVISAIVGFLATSYFSSSLSVGASGGVMGMLGALAGWGHRDGTPSGIELRNFALVWLAFVTVFGLLMNADHLAHFGGFISGAIVGFSDTRISFWQRRIGWWAHVPFTIALLLTFMAMWRVLFPMYFPLS